MRRDFPDMQREFGWRVDFATMPGISAAAGISRPLIEYRLHHLRRSPSGTAFVDYRRRVTLIGCCGLNDE